MAAVKTGLPALVLALTCLAGVARANDGARSGGTVVLGTYSVWRMHYQIEPPVLWTGERVSFDYEWPDYKTAARPADWAAQESDDLPIPNELCRASPTTLGLEVVRAPYPESGGEPGKDVYNLNTCEIMHARLTPDGPSGLVPNARRTAANLAEAATMAAWMGATDPAMWASVL